MENQNVNYCQSCGMPMNAPDAQYGMEKDGSLSQDYCSYCYADGQFTSDKAVEQMVETCLPFVREHYKSDDEARADMMAFFPQLKRWKQD